MKESDLQKQIGQWLTHAGVFWKRVPLGGVMQGGGKFMSKNPLKGFPDIFGFIPLTKTGQIFVIECKKAKTGRMSKEQNEWRLILKAFGVLYVEARSLQDVVNIFAIEGVR